jgi:hypothetical protein
MDAFQRCVQDLGSIDRLLQLPHGRDIAVEMFRELSPYLDQLTGLKEQDPTGALACLLDFADAARARLNIEKFASGVQPNMRPSSPRVA